jgi:hypothetical protein
VRVWPLAVLAVWRSGGLRWCWSLFLLVAALPAFRLLAGFALRLFVAGWVRLAAFRLLAGFARR